MAVRGAAGCGREERGSRVRGLCARWRRGSPGAGGDRGVRAAPGPEASFVSASGWGVGSRLLWGDSGPGGATAWEPGPRGTARAVVGRGGARGSQRSPRRCPLAGGGARACAQAARPGRKRPRRPGSSDAGRPGARGPFGVTSQWGLRPRESRVPGRTAAHRPCPWPRGSAPGRQGTREEDAGTGRKAVSPSAAGGGVLQDAGLTFGALVAGGGRRGAEGKRNTRQARGRGGPSFLGRPFSQRAVSLLGFWVGLKSTPGAGVRPEPCPGSGSPRRARRWGSGPEWRRLSRVTMRYWGAGGGEAARLNGDPGPGLPRVSAGSDPGPVRDPHGSLHPECPPPFVFQRSGVLRIQGHYIWLQSSFMPLLGC